ncbi:MAG: hypothetical protein LUC06_06175 [Oscillospiraceae bacterium]|nr:hypothetical protein [Oscillospiraceae bacterium]
MRNVLSLAQKSILMSKGGCGLAKHISSLFQFPMKIQKSSVPDEWVKIAPFTIHAKSGDAPLPPPASCRCTQAMAGASERQFTEAGKRCYHLPLSAAPALFLTQHFPSALLAG